jgi:hypothetical protein
VQKLNDSFANPSGSDTGELREELPPVQATAADLARADDAPSKTD